MVVIGTENLWVLVVSCSGQRVYGILQTPKVTCWMNIANSSTVTRQSPNYVTMAELHREKIY